MNKISERRSFLTAPAILLVVATLFCPADRPRSASAAHHAMDEKLHTAADHFRPDAVRLRIDEGRSQLTIRAFTGGLLSSFAHDHTIAARSLSGEARFTPGSLSEASLHLTVSAGSLVVVDKISEKDRREIEHRMREEVLESARYPEITFRSTGVQAERTSADQYTVRIEGDLSLHGVTRRHTIVAQVTTAGRTLRARGEFRLRQSDYKIRPPSVGMGTIKVKDALKLSFDITAR